MLQISELFIYPIKSLAGIAVNKADVTDRGFKYDRRWMLVDMQNRFLTQREHTQMALIKVVITDHSLVVSHSEHGFVNVPFQVNLRAVQNVTIWDDTCTGVFVNREVDEWFSGVLSTKCRLIYMPDDSFREIDQRYAPPGKITSFADAYPFLLIGQASLNDLNERLAEPLPMNRFRPNLVFTGGLPFSEDLMNKISIADVNFYGVKLCARCAITTIDQQSGTKAKEPLQTLAKFRYKDNKILFGQNLIHEGYGVISVGDTISVLSTHEEKRFLVPV